MKFLKNTLFLLTILGLSVGCQSEKKSDSNVILAALLSSVSSCGTNSVSFNKSGRSTCANVTPVTVETGKSGTLVYNRVPVVNHPIGIIYLPSVTTNTIVNTNPIDVADFDTDTSSVYPPLIYSGSSLPLNDSNLASSTSYTRTKVDSTNYRYQFNSAGSYYLLFYIVGTSEVTTTVSRTN
jgi:hypothetical protein